MINFRIYRQSALSFLFSVVVILSVSAQQSRSIDEISRSNTEFAFGLYQTLRSEEGNLFFSPHSISTAMSMTYAGARGDTATQMAETLRFKKSSEVHKGYAAIIKNLEKAQSTDGVKLSVANSLWPQKEYPFLESYTQLIQESYAAEVNALDYGASLKKASKKINRWVEGKTENKIKDLLDEGDLTPLTRLVLVNAIYFKGEWESGFEKKDTYEADFSLFSGDKVKVPMMTQTDQFRYADLGQYSVLEVPYKGNRFSVLFVLPKLTANIRELEKSLTKKEFQILGESLREQKVEVHLPKFKLEKGFRLSDTLISMGMFDAFDATKANFAGMDGREVLSIDKVIHKAFVEVNEEGTEAAAATAVTIELRGLPSPPARFHANRPFLFFIQEKQSQTLLFMGRMMNPVGDR